MKEEILKQFKEKFSTTKTIGTNDFSISTGKKLEIFILEVMNEVHNNALKMIEDGLPEKQDKMFENVESPNLIRQTAFNDFREQVIKTLKKLKI